MNLDLKRVRLLRRRARRSDPGPVAQVSEQRAQGRKYSSERDDHEGESIS